jgi:hypothetical protein
MHVSRRAAAQAVFTAALAGVAFNACRADQPPSPPATTASPSSAAPTERVVGPISEADARALATMNEGLKAYLELHRKIERTLPRLSADATPEQIDSNQRLFEARLREARAGARAGDIFTPQAAQVIVRLLDAVFGGEQGRLLKESIMDENPVGVKVTVNGRYPDTAPIATVPPQVLQTLPKLTEDMEYRFVGDALIILDAHAHVIADYIDNALPK